MTAYTEPQRPLETILYEVPNLAREEITIVSGAGVVKAGTVVGKITASGKYTPYDDGAEDGSETAAAVTLYEVDATSADVVVSALVRLAAVKSDALQWHASADATAKAAAATALAAAHLLIRS